MRLERIGFAYIPSCDEEELRNELKNIKEQLGIDISLSSFETASSYYVVGKIEETLAYTFTVLIVLLSVLNVYNII